MIREPWFTFDGTTDVGLDKVPLNSNIHIIDSDGSGTPIMILIHDKTGITGTTTIQDLLDLPSQWFEVGPNRHGKIYETGSTTYTPDLLKNDHFEYTLDQNTTINAPINWKEGDVGKITIKQDLLGSHAVAWNEAYTFPTSEPILVTGTYESSIFIYRIDAYGNAIMEYTNTITGRDISGAYDHFVLWDTQSGDTSFTSDADWEYSNDGGASFSTLTAGTDVATTTGTGPYILATNNQPSFWRVGTINPGNFNSKITINISGMNTGLQLLYNTLNLIEADVSGLDTSNMTSMADMFYKSKISVTPDISQWDTSNVTRFDRFMREASNITTAPDISQWDTSSLNNFNEMFMLASSMVDAPDVSNFDTSRCTNIVNIFLSCTSMIETPDVSKWNLSLCTSIVSIFNGCSEITIAPDVSKWDVSNVLSFSLLFRLCNKLIIPPNVSTWDTGSGTLMNAIFRDMSSIATQPNVSTWDLSSVTSIAEMFMSNTSMEYSPDVSNWDVSKVEQMNSIFYNNVLCPVAPDVSKWNVSIAISMVSMFQNCHNYIAFPDLSLWTPTLIENTKLMFNNTCWYSTQLNPYPNMSGFEMSNLTDISNMFSQNGLNFNLVDIDNINAENWNIPLLANASEFMSYTNGFTTGTYDTLLINWAAQIPSVQPGVNVDFGPSTYTLGGAAATAKTDLEAEGWVITDGGGV